MVAIDHIATETVLDTIEWLSVSQVHSDHRVNTRPVDTAWVDKKVREGFDPHRVGVPTVSKRPDGTYVWLDGQNRGELIRRSGWSDQKIQCRVFYGLTTAQEASQFLGLNDNRQVKPVYKFLARITSGETHAVAVNTIVEAAGWRISDQSSNRGITAVGSLEKVYHDTPDAPGRALAMTLRVVTEAWGFKPGAVAGDVLLGIGTVFVRFHDRIDTPALTKKLAEFPAGPSGLLGKARGLRQFQGGTVAQCAAETVVNAYNTRRRSGALPDWR